MSEIHSNKAGLDPQTYQEAQDLLAAWDRGNTGSNLVLDYHSRGRFALWAEGRLVYLGSRREVFAYVRGLIHGRLNRINL